MQFTQQHIRADRARLETGQKVFGLGFDDYQGMNQIKRFLSAPPLPAIPGGPGFVFDDGVEGVLPGPGRDTRIGSRQIGLGDLEVQLRLPDGFIAGVEQHRGLGANLRAQAFLLSGFGVLEVEHTAGLAAVEDEAMFHNLGFFVRKL
ncbi:MAG: hypothetical protein HOP33_21945 [Verrucomicrobia bacterium]|nr:hypothetical protein [Verrucomicrobiota bacterium]